MQGIPAERKRERMQETCWSGGVVVVVLGPVKVLLEDSSFEEQ